MLIRMVVVIATYLFIGNPASVVRPCRFHVHRRLCGGWATCNPA
jgi:hypothetical protein